MKEWHRTVILLVLIAIAIGFIVWSHSEIQTNFLRGL